MIAGLTGWQKALRVHRSAPLQGNTGHIAESAAADLWGDVGTGQGVAGLTLRTFEFDVATVNSSGAVVQARKGRARYYTEDLGGGVTLEMVEVPEGTFMMGTSYQEAEQVVGEYQRHLGDDTKHFGERYVPQQIPRHEVRVPTFYIGKFEVTQAQWRRVATLPKLRRDLASDPSFFRGDDLPAETISWEDAVEFCDRLSKKTGRSYRLPSEDEWEYACRAGTTTQFHYGETITAELVNYDGLYPYGSAPKGLNRERTVKVGSLGTANLFGLYDMHGNVSEWCMDPWHENYNSAPSDGRVWEFQGDKSLRVLRGCSWLNIPCYCRSANRSPYWFTRTSNDTGFRVVAGR
jgi:formylglycine-generating enzyme required for sulfatase activity